MTRFITIGAAALAATVFAGPAHAHGFGFNLGIQLPFIAPPPVVYAQPPTIYAPPPAVYARSYPGFHPPTVWTPTPVLPDETTRWVQAALNSLTGAGLDVDGIAGPATVDALMAFQSANGLAVDGIAGSGTIAVLEGQLRRLPPPPPPQAPAPTH